MGRASGNGMSGSIIHTNEDWSDWKDWVELDRDAKRFNLERPIYDEILHLKELYHQKGTRNRHRYAELRSIVDDLDWTKYTTTAFKSRY